MNLKNILKIYKASDIPNSNVSLTLFLASCFLLSALEILGLASVGALLVQVFGGEDKISFVFIEFGSQLLASVFILCIWLFRGVMVFFLNRYNFRFIQNIKSGIQSKQFDVAFASKQRSDQIETGKLFAALTNEVQMMTGQVFTPVAMALAEVMLALMFLSFALFIMPVGVLMAVSIVIFGYAITSMLINPIARRLGQKRLEAEQSWSEKVVNMFSLRREAGVYGVIQKIKTNLVSQVIASNILSGKFYSIAPLNRALLETFGVLAVVALLFFAQQAETPNEHIMFVLLALVRMLPSATRILAASQSYRFAEPVIKKQLAYLNQASLSAIKNTNNIRLEGTQIEYTFHDDVTPKQVRLPLDQHGLIAISGESGLGKTTMLDDLVDFLLSKRAEGLEYAQKISYASQNNLVIEQGIEKNLEFYRSLSEGQLVDGLNILKFWGLTSELFNEECRVSDFSGGEKKRVTIARALSCSEAIIIMDEPTSGLDQAIAKRVIESICEKAKKNLVIVATHDKLLFDCADTKFSLEKAAKND